MFGQIETLVRKIDYSSMKAEHAIKKVASTGDPVKQASYNNAGAGTVNMAVNLENQKRFKRGSVNAFQNALTMMQAQTEALSQADKIYNRMRSLAQMASDPMMNSDDRTLLSEQFNDLRDQAYAIANSKFNDNMLFDPLAASTKYNITFGKGQLKVLTTVPALTVFEEKDVLYNKGKMIIDVNGGTSPEQYTLWQGNQKIFDTGLWKTEGSARTYDYDRFIVEFGPEQETTFQFVPLSPGDNTPVDSISDPPGYPGNLNDNGVYDNKSRYLSQLGLSDDGTSSGIEYIKGQKFTSLGQVTTNTINSESSLLRLQVYTPSSIFQVKGSFELPDLEEEIVARGDDLQLKLPKLGLGLLREDDGDEFPLISIDSLEDAQKAIASMSKELDGLGKQLGPIASNFNQVNNAMSATEEMEHMSGKVLSEIGGQNLTNDLLSLSKSRINRAQDTALLTQAMSIHRDLVNVLIY